MGACAYRRERRSGEARHNHCHNHFVEDMRLEEGSRLVGDILVNIRVAGTATDIVVGTVVAVRKAVGSRPVARRRRSPDSGSTT